MPFALSATSLSHTSHVHPDLMAVARRAIELTTQDFGFTEEQSRTLADQAKKVAEGHAQTMHTHHLIKAGTNYSEALDAVPFVGGKPVWQWPLIYPVAAAFKQASIELKTDITWGGVWDKLMTEYDGDDPAAMKAAQEDYVARRHKAGHKTAFLDGPHFELGRN